MANVFGDSTTPIEPITRIGRLSQFCNPKPPPTVRVNADNDAELPLSTVQLRVTQTVDTPPPDPDADDLQGSDMLVVNTTTHNIQHQVPSTQPVPVFLKVLSHSPIGLGTMSPTGTSPIAWDIEIDPYGHILMCTETPISSSSSSSGSSSGSGSSSSSSSSSSGDAPPEDCLEAGDGIPDGPVHFINDDLSHDTGWVWSGNGALLSAYATGSFTCGINEHGEVQWLWSVSWYTGSVWVGVAGVCIGWPLGNTFEVFWVYNGGSLPEPYASAGHKTLVIGPG